MSANCKRLRTSRLRRSSSLCDRLGTTGTSTRDCLSDCLPGRCGRRRYGDVNGYCLAGAGRGDCSWFGDGLICSYSCGLSCSGRGHGCGDSLISSYGLCLSCSGLGHSCGDGVRSRSDGYGLSCSSCSDCYRLSLGRSFSLKLSCSYRPSHGQGFSVSLGRSLIQSCGATVLPREMLNETAWQNIRSCGNLEA